jgi:20S proteasome subunit alpha 2
MSMLMAGCDSSGPHLFQVDPSGAYFEWKASAIGRNMDNAKLFLEKRYSEEMELEDAIHTALLTLKEGFEGEMDENNIELAVVSTTDSSFKILTAEEVRDYLSELS